MHLLGLDGMPRRVYTYPAEMGWGKLNLLATVGAVLIVLSAVVFLVNVVVSLRRGARRADPWGRDAGVGHLVAAPPYNSPRNRRGQRGRSGTRS